MSRQVASIETLTALAAGVPVSTTVNGYIGALIPGSASNFKLRRLILGMRGPAGSITSDQHTIGLYRQTARASGTGFSTMTFGAEDTNGPASVSTGFDYTTATTFGTAAPTLGANPLHRLTFNTAGFEDIPFEFPDDWFVCPLGTANGIGLVNIGNAFPTSTLLAVTAVIEE